MRTQTNVTNVMNINEVDFKDGAANRQWLMRVAVTTSKRANVRRLCTPPPANSPQDLTRRGYRTKLTKCSSGVDGLSMVLMQ